MVPFERSSLFLPNLSSKDFMTKNSKKATRWKYLQCIQYRYTGLWNVLSYVYFLNRQITGNVWSASHKLGRSACIHSLNSYHDSELHVTPFYRCGNWGAVICLRSNSWWASPASVDSDTAKEKKLVGREMPPAVRGMQGRHWDIFWALNLKQSNICESQS